MKKIILARISMLCVICLISMNISVFALEDTDTSLSDKYIDKCNQAVAVLKALNILGTELDGLSLAEPSEPVNRGEYIQAIINLMGLYANTLSKEEYYFTDVPKDDDYANAINLAQKLGLVKGFEGKTFRPDETISLYEATKILIDALGYGFQAENSGGYPIGYLNQASTLKLYKGINEKSEELTKGAAVLLLYNSLEVDVLSRRLENDKVVHDLEKDINVLRKFLKSDVTDGIMTQTYKTSLTGNTVTALRSDEVLIDNAVYRAGKTKAQDFIGQRVKIYYSTENGENTLCYIEAYQTESITVQSDNIKRYSDRIFAYTDDMDENGKVIELKVSKTTDVIYNGKAYPGYKDSDLLISDGYVTLIDNDLDDRYDVILITEYKDFIVDSVSSIDKTIYFRYPNNDKRDLSALDENLITVLDSSGDSAELSDISPNDVVMIKESKDHSCIEVTIGKEKLDGTVTELLDEANAEIDYMKKGIASSFREDMKKYEVGFMGTFLLDARGKIAGVVDKFGDVRDYYGYLVKIFQKQGLDQKISTKILTMKGSMEIYTIGDKLEIDGNASTKSAFYNQFTGDGHTRQQLIRYRLLNDSKIICFVDSAEVLGSKEDANVALKSKHIGLKKYIDATRSFGKAAIINAKTVVFEVPKEESGIIPDTIDDSYYLVNKMEFNNGSQYEFDIYNYDEVNICPFIVYKQPYRGDAMGGNPNKVPNSDALSVVVDKVTVTTNDKGDKVPKLYYMDGSIIKNLTAKDMNTLMKPVYDSNGAKISNQYRLVESGDIIQYAVDSNNIIESITVNLDGSRRDSTRFVEENNSGQVIGIEHGLVYAKSRGGISILPHITTTSQDAATLTKFGNKYAFDSSYQNCWTLENVNVIVYDTETKKIRKGEYSDIRDWKSNHSNPSLALIRSKYGEIKQLFIIN